MRNKGSSSSGQRPVFNGDQTKPEEALRAANVVIVKNLNHAARKIQIQALEVGPSTLRSSTTIEIPPALTYDSHIHSHCRLFYAEAISFHRINIDRKSTIGQPLGKCIVR